jgi:hypothetical protein
MHFSMKNYLKNNHNFTVKSSLIIMCQILSYSNGQESKHLLRRQVCGRNISEKCSVIVHNHLNFLVNNNSIT